MHGVTYYTCNVIYKKSVDSYMVVDIGLSANPYLSIVNLYIFPSMQTSYS